MQTVADFINALGGTISVANALTLAPTTVSSWKSADSIPNWRLPAIHALASQKKVAVPKRFRVSRKSAA